MPSPVFITGASGFIGSALIPALLARGYAVHALRRPESRRAPPPGCTVTGGDVLDPESYAAHIPPGSTFVHLVGVPRPTPLKAGAFLRVDLASVEAALRAARVAGACHFVYVSVAQPAPVMRAYVAARVRAEALIRASGIPATVLRPWYVLGPGRRWPYPLLPLYGLLEYLPATRDTARRLAPVTLSQMILALVRAIERPAGNFHIVEVSGMRGA